MAQYTPIVDEGLDRLREMVRGNFDLKWMESNPQGWGHTAIPGPSGLGLADVETGHYAKIPEFGSSHGSMAPRGSFVPENTPSLGMYDLNEPPDDLGQLRILDLPDLAYHFLIASFAASKPASCQTQCRQSL